MNLIYFIRLLLKHWLLLVLSPICLFVVIFYLTKDEPKTYNSFTSIYTGIASGSSLTSLESTKIDRLSTLTAFDNLINIVKLRSTLEEVGLRLFTSHMILEKPDRSKIGKEEYDKLMQRVPEKIKKLVVKNDFDATYDAFYKYMHKNNNNYIYTLVSVDHPHYSYEKILGKLRVRRKNSSDMIGMSYSSNDPGICQQTLEILTQVFIVNYSKVKINQSDAILRYFQDQLDMAQNKLDTAEDELLEFNKANNIINYYEQTEHIAFQKEMFASKYNEIQMEYAGAESVLKVLEEKLSVQEKRFVNNSDIVELRNKLAEINIDKAIKHYQAQFDTINEAAYLHEIAELETQSKELQNRLRNSINQAYYIDNSVEGVGSKNVLTEWLEEVINLETARAKLLVGKERKDEFRSLVKEYAPKGATMKRLERKINIAEREYLSILHSLNLAKLKQQNVELNSNLKVSDPPLFPLKSEPSKRKMLLLVGLVIGFILPASVLILLDFVDQSIRSAKRAEELTGLSVAAIFPKLNNVSRKLDVEFIKERAIDVLARRLMLNREKRDKKNNEPDSNLVFSILDREGKTMLLNLLIGKLVGIGYKVLCVTYEKDQKIEGADICEYEVTESFHKCENVTDLVTESCEMNLAAYDFIFIEVPGILQHSYPINLFNGIDHSFLVTRANRSWTKSDANAIKDIVEFTPNRNPQIILNGVEMLEMENVIGDLPKRRSKLRQLIKNVFRLRFFTKNDWSKDPKKRKKRKVMNIFLLLVMCSSPFIYSYSMSEFEEDEQQAIVEPVVVQMSQLEEVQPEQTIRVEPIEVDIKAEIPETRAVPKTVSKKAGYYVICGCFNKPENAAQKVEELEALNFQPQLITRKNGMIAVALGGVEKHSDARKILDEFLTVDSESGAWILKKK